MHVVYPKVSRARATITWTSVWLNLVFSVAYQFPEKLVRRLPQPGEVRISIVQFIEQAGPVWIVGFGGAALAVGAAMIARRCLTAAHMLGGIVWAGYSAAVTFSIFASRPTGSILLPATAIAITIAHLALVDAYSGDVARKEFMGHER
jgi:hypothetical protein